MLARPGVIVFALLALGMGLGSVARGADASVLLAGSGALGVLGAIGRSAWCVRAGVGAGIVSLGMGWWILRVESAPGDFLGDALPTDESIIVRIEGVVRTAARRDEPIGALARFSPLPPTWSFEMEADALIDRLGRRVATSGVALVRVGEARPGVVPGDLVRVEGRARGVGGARNPGEPDWRRWARQHERAGALDVPAASLVERIERSEERWASRGARALQRAQAWLRARAMAPIAGGADEAGDARGRSDARTTGRSVALAMLLGERTAPLEDARGAFARLGLSHMLAISGLHLALLAGVTLGALRLAAPGWKHQPLALAGVIGVYLVLTPAHTPVLRAGVMLLGALAAQAAGRRYDQLNTLALVGVGLLLWRPLELVSPGFQLSFLVVAGLVGLTPALWNRLLGEAGDPDARPLGARLRRHLGAAAITAIVAWAISSPLAAWQFGVFPTVGWLLALLLAPLLSVALAIGYAAMALGLLWPEGGAALGEWCVLLCARFAGVVAWMETLPGMTIRLARLDPLWAAGATIALAWTMRTGLSRPGLKALVFCALGGWLAWMTLGATRLAGDQAARLDTLDVGQGTCHLFRSGEEAMLWDCGAKWSGVGVRAIPDAVRALGAGRVETVVISHADIDHFSGLPDAAWALGVRRALVTEWTLLAAERSERGPEAALLRSLRVQGVAIETVHAGDSIRIGEALVEFLHPPAPAAGRKGFESDNDASLVARIVTPTDAGDRRILLTGDIAEEAMEDMDARGVDLACHALEAPHHGSAIPAAYAFVAEADPRVVIQSTDRSRLDDPRWAEQRRGRRWLATARRGAISTIVGKNGQIEIRTWRR